MGAGAVTSKCGSGFPGVECIAGRSNSRTKPARAHVSKALLPFAGNRRGARASHTNSTEERNQAEDGCHRSLLKKRPPLSQPFAPSLRVPALPIASGALRPICIRFPKSQSARSRKQVLNRRREERARRSILTRSSSSIRTRILRITLRLLIQTRMARAAIDCAPSWWRVPI